MVTAEDACFRLYSLYPIIQYLLNYPGTFFFQFHPIYNNTQQRYIHSQKALHGVMKYLNANLSHVEFEGKKLSCRDRTSPPLPMPEYFLVLNESYSSKQLKQNKANLAITRQLLSAHILFEK